MRWTTESRQALIGAEVLSGLAALAMKEVMDKDGRLYRFLRRADHRRYPLTLTCQLDARRHTRLNGRMRSSPASPGSLIYTSRVQPVP